MYELTVSELIQELKKMPGELIVVLSSDDEGNGYRELFYPPTLGVMDEDGEVHFETEAYDINVGSYIYHDVDEEQANVVVLG